MNSWILLVLLLCKTVNGAAKDDARLPIAKEDEEIVKVRCEMKGKGEFDITVVPSWAPLGSARFLEMVEDGFFDGTALFRAVPKFLCQFGVSRDDELQRKYGNARVADDPKRNIRINRGTLAFAGNGVDSRTSQMFVALSSSSWPHLGKEPWETPFGYISDQDMERVWSKLNMEYGDMKPWGKNGVDMGRFHREGYQYLEEEFPNMDYLTYCKVVKKEPEPVTGLWMDSVSSFEGNSDVLLIVAALLLLVILYRLCKTVLIGQNLKEN